MNLEQLKLIAEQRETKTVELKSSTASLRSAFESVCAFLNGEGGIVIIGAKDHGELVGQEISDATRLDIAREIKRIEPTGSIDIDYVGLKKDKTIIVIQVPAGEHAPYVYDGRPFERHESGTDRMSQHRYEQLLVERGQLNHNWEEFPSKLHIDDLDHNEIYRAVEQGIAVNRVPANLRSLGIQDILIHWELLREDGVLNNAAAVLFAKKITPGYLQCHLKLGRFKGQDMLGYFIDNKDFYGNAFQILEEADQFIRRHLPIASFFKSDQFERIDKPTLPVLAVREALVNAICHRDYSNRASSMTLAIFDDRMEIWNNGKLPPSLSINDLKKKHKSEPRNKIIAKVFYDRKYFDGWGMGISKIFELCREADVPEPTYEQYSGGVEISFKFKEPIGAEPAELKHTNLPLLYELTARHKNILEILASDRKMTVAQIAEKLENAPAARTIGDDLAHLKELKLVALEGFGRGSKWSLSKTSANKGAEKG